MARAVRVYEAALAAGADLALTYYNLGYLRQKAGKRDRAERLYGEAIARDPGHVLAHSTSATCCSCAATSRGPRSNTGLF